MNFSSRKTALCLPTGRQGVSVKGGSAYGGNFARGEIKEGQHALRQKKKKTQNKDA